MSRTFAKGKNALGICDTCGLTYKLSTLKPTMVRMRPTGLRVCPTCFDPDHPQNRQGLKPINDPQALRNPRPDTGAEASREIEGDWEELMWP